MLEFIINFGLFLLFIIVVITISALVRRSTVLTALFRYIGVAIFYTAKAFLAVALIIMQSTAAGFFILIHPFILRKIHFFANDEPVYFGTEQNQALFIFSLTYGILQYLLLKLSVKTLSGTKIESLFLWISRKILFPYKYSLQKKRFELKVATVASLLMTSTAIFLVYPVVITLLFPDLKVTLLGSFVLFISLSVVIFLAPGQRYNYED